MGVDHTRMGLKQDDQLRGIFNLLSEKWEGGSSENGQKKWVWEIFQQICLNSFKSPWLILLKNSYNHFHCRCHTTFPAPTLEAYLFIFQVHDFLPNYLSSTHQSNSTMQLESLTVTRGLVVSVAPLLCLCPQQSSSMYSENNSSKSPVPLQHSSVKRWNLDKDVSTGWGRKWQSGRALIWLHLIYAHLTQSHHVPLLLESEVKTKTA